MAIVRATKTGNWSDTTVWNTGALPTSSDDVYSNTFTVTIDTSPTVLSISNATATGVTAGGSYIITNGVTLTCTATNGVIYGAGNNVTLINSSLTFGQSCSISGKGIYATTPLNGYLLAHSGAGTINYTGDMFGCNGGATAHAIYNTSSGIINITGNVTGGNSNSTAITNSGTGTINLTGSATGGIGIAGSTGFGVNNTSTGTINITGNCYGGSGSGPSNVGVNNNSTGTINVTGSCTSSTSSPAITCATSTGTIIVTGPFLTSSNGVNPNTCLRWFWQNTSAPSTYYQVRTANLSIVRSLYTADSVGGNPAITNVRSGTVYGPASELTGTCAVPGAASVVVGVPIDATTGTAAITGDTIRNALGLSSANLDNQLLSISKKIGLAILNLF